jgi:hypothetical protein
MKAHALVPALALAAALLAPPLASAAKRHRSDRGHGRRTYQHGYSYQAPRVYGHGYYRYRPYTRAYRYYVPPVPYGYYGYYNDYPLVPYGYYPPPEYYYRPYYRPRSGVYLNFGFRF